MATGKSPQGYSYLDDQQEQPEVIVNQNIDTQEQLNGGIIVIPWPSDADYTLATSPTDGSPPEWQYATVYVTDTGGVLTADRNLIAPAIGKPYVIANGTLKKITLKTTVTGKWSIQVNADRIEHLMTTAAGNVFPVAGQVSLTPPT